jgi:UDP-glucose 4-epimerase
MECLKVHQAGDREGVLITGVAGFIGSNLAEVLLARSYRVLGVDDLSIGRIENIAHLLENPRFKFVVGDITNEEFVASLPREAKCIVHLASFKIPKYGDALKTLLVNAQGTSNILELAAKHDVKVVFSSTSDVYGKNTRFDEEADLVLGPPGVRRWAYAISKAYDEQLCLAYKESCGLKVVVLRYFNAYGPRHDLTWRGGPQSVFIDSVLHDKEIVIHGDGTQTRCFTFVSDIIQGTVLAMERNEANGEIFNIGNDKTEISITELARLIARVARKSEPKLRFVRHEELFGRYEEVLVRRPDIGKARRMLGYKPEVGLEEGLKVTIEWQRRIPSVHQK